MSVCNENPNHLSYQARGNDSPVTNCTNIPAARSHFFYLLNIFVDKMGLSFVWATVGPVFILVL